MARKEANAAGARRGPWKQRLSLLAGAAVVILVAVVVRHNWGPDSASAQAPRTAAKAAPSTPQPAASPAVAATPQAQKTMAVVNGVEITRQMLAKECVERYGIEVLESLVNKRLITLHCQQHNITVTREEINAEIERMASRFHLASDQWLKMLEKERGIKAEQYARDIVWPTLALRKLAADRLQVSPEELRKAYESEFGPAVQARLITVTDLNLARRLHAQLKAQPDDFAKLAREHSQDISSASLGGMIQPIRRHLGDPQIEQVVFNLKEGEISPIVRVGEQYVILHCEGHIPPRQVAVEDVRSQLEEKIREAKLHTVGAEIFQQLQKDAVVENVFNDPVRSRQQPGVAATINGHRVMLNELAEECIARHGEEVLEGQIHRMLLEHELKKANLQVTREELDAEIVHAVELAGVITQDGKPDLARWKELVTKQQGIDFDQYVRDAVWPSAALKKLVTNRVEVTQEDLQKAFEANYGPRVRCRAIVMSNLRRAQEVWDQARRDPTAENFGDLAEQFSVEASSRSLRGEVPPIKKHGGQKLLEQEAFKLQPGEISSVIQLGDKYVILFCEGYTEPIKVEPAEVQELLFSDLHEKKLRLAMSERFDQLRTSAQIDNFLTGTSQSPKQELASQPGGRPAAGRTGVAPAQRR